MEPGLPLRLGVETTAVNGSQLGAIRGEWDALAARVGASPFLILGWLESWAATYAPRGLILVRVTDPELGTVALGLLEEARWGMLRFAGGRVTPVRGLLCSPVHELTVWRALGEWLDRRSGWTLLDASGVSPLDLDLARAVITPLPWFAFSLPDSFQEYLVARGGSTRRDFRRRLRVAERAGVTTRRLTGTSVGSGLKDFVRLHNDRARTKGELHSDIDDRIVTLLNTVAQIGTPELRVFVVEQAGKTLAVGVQLDHAGVSCAYNTGFDPAASRLSPGTLLRLASIRDAIERGGKRFDLGPGGSDYKRHLGGEPVVRVRVQAANSRSITGALVRMTVIAHHRFRAFATEAGRGRRVAQPRRDDSAAEA